MSHESQPAISLHDPHFLFHRAELMQLNVPQPLSYPLATMQPIIHLLHYGAMYLRIHFLLLYKPSYTSDPSPLNCHHTPETRSSARTMARDVYLDSANCQNLYHPGEEDRGPWDAHREVRGWTAFEYNRRLVKILWCLACRDHESPFRARRMEGFYDAMDADGPVPTMGAMRKMAGFVIWFNREIGPEGWIHSVVPDMLGLRAEPGVGSVEEWRRKVLPTGLRSKGLGGGWFVVKADVDAYEAVQGEEKVGWETVDEVNRKTDGILAKQFLDTVYLQQVFSQA